MSCSKGAAQLVGPHHAIIVVRVVFHNTAGLGERRGSKNEHGSAGHHSCAGRRTVTAINIVGFLDSSRTSQHTVKQYHALLCATRIRDSGVARAVGVHLGNSCCALSYITHHLDAVQPLSRGISSRVIQALFPHPLHKSRARRRVRIR